MQAHGSAGESSPHVTHSRRLDFFEYLTPEAKRDFDAAATSRRFAAGESIYLQDDRHHLMYRLIAGRVWLSYATADGREHLAGLLGPGECFGISPLIDGEGVPQNATARSSVTVQILDETALARLRAAHRSVDEAIMRSLLRDIRILSSELSSTSLADLRSRLARQLLALAGRGRHGDPVVRLTQAELAGVLGVSRQTLNRQLRHLEAEGTVALTYGEVRLRDLSALSDLASNLD
ncbi:putative transcriptional regulator, Crp family [Gordonia polyisoprenivorans VH2]|uniref:Putative transcriptional regulator, Crp family n=1 Tax=Gordonia polyisoprenivorans (strain DSM 44266 / VH2) TaxID=1112204 RepID=H6MZ63_GORPV|nr:Crp/Fnr family transcriptional regulator [Gordonia polyisoprenivorans]AFA74399.1 putative transcriptional regulator, Crp family [Gordonia polyisoprenivorans VH2]